MIYDYDRRTGATTPVPNSFRPDEIGLMTKTEFLAFRNPDGKSHSSDSYDVSLMRMNEEHGTTIGQVGYGTEAIRVRQLSHGFELTRDGKLVGIVHRGTAYYDNPRVKKWIPSSLPALGGGQVDLGIEKFRHVKYLSEVAPLISPIAKKNEAEYPTILQRIIVKGEPMTVRAEQQPVLNKGTTLVILNSQGLRVAQASDEWGATLLAVVQEYRGKGLGKIIGRLWYEYNPSWRSGGFTQSGERNAIALWAERVREFASRGWYTELLREGRITEARIREILKDVGQRLPRAPVVEPSESKATGKTLIYADDVAFVIYDRAFLDDPNEKFIHGYGFFRNNHKGTFLYRIEYDRAYADLVTKVALQMAKDNGERIYDAPELRHRPAGERRCHSRCRARRRLRDGHSKPAAAKSALTARAPDARAPRPLPREIPPATRNGRRQVVTYL